jgi:hypothetical protein
MKRYTSLFTTFLLICSTMSCCKEEEDTLDINQLVAIWELYEFTDKNDNNLVVPDIRISFTENNCVTVFTSYNYGQGKFYQSGNNITVNELTLTNREVGLDNDNRFVNNLTGSYNIIGDTLHILSANDYDMVLLRIQTADIYQCDLSTLLIDKFDSNRYYPEDIFQQEYSAIYGKWFLSSVYGGWGGGEEIPRFDFLEVKKNGIYGICKGFDLVEYGKIEMTKLTEEKLLLNFIPTYYLGDIRWSFSSERLSFPVNDTLILHDDCLDCYHYRLSRIK